MLLHLECLELAIVYLFEVFKLSLLFFNVLSLLLNQVLFFFNEASLGL